MAGLDSLEIGAATRAAQYIIWVEEDQNPK